MRFTAARGKRPCCRVSPGTRVRGPTPCWLPLGSRYGADAISYAFSLAKGSTGCEADAIGQLVDMLEQVRRPRCPEA